MIYLKSWKVENPKTYRRMQISTEIRKLRQEKTKLMLKDMFYKHIDQKIEKLQEQYKNL